MRKVYVLLGAEVAVTALVIAGSLLGQIPGTTAQRSGPALTPVTPWDTMPTVQLPGVQTPVPRRTPPPVPPPPAGGKAPSPPSAQQIIAQPTVQQLLRESAAQGTPGRPALSFGAGGRITIAGKQVQLPPDARVKQVITRVWCVAEEPCPETPAYEIVRGESRIFIGIQSGQVIEERIAPGAGQPFQSLKDALQGSGD